MYNEFQMISNNIKFLREKKGYTQEQLAEMTGLSVSHISKVEAGQRRVGMKTYINILQVLEVKPEDYVTYAIKEETPGYLQQLSSILEDCTETEKKFLINTLQYLKGNLKDLTLSVAP